MLTYDFISRLIYLDIKDWISYAYGLENLKWNTCNIWQFVVD